MTEFILLQVLKNLKSARPTDEEVARARLLIKNNLITSLEESRLQMAEYLRIQSVRGQLIHPKQFLETLDQVKVCHNTCKLLFSSVSNTSIDAFFV